MVERSRSTERCVANDHFLDILDFPGYVPGMLTRFDQANKQLLRAALQNDGTFTSELEVSPDPQYVDGYFVPNPNRTPVVMTTLLGRMTKRASSFENFSSPPDIVGLSECARKILNQRHILRTKDDSADLPYQWVVSAGKPISALDAHGACRAKGWPRGIYHLPTALASSVVVTNELPEDRSTLMLRLMGRGRTLRRAIAELKTLSEDEFERHVALPILVRYHFEAKEQPVSPADEEYVMNTQEAIDLFERRAEHRGELRGVPKGQRDLLLTLLRQKFGELPEAVVARVLAADVDKLERFASRVLWANTPSDVVEP